MPIADLFARFNPSFIKLSAVCLCRGKISSPNQAKLLGLLKMKAGTFKQTSVRKIPTKHLTYLVSVCITKSAQ